MVRILLFQTLGLLALNFTAMSYYGQPRMQLAIWLIGGTALFVTALCMIREQLLTEQIAAIDAQIAELDAVIATLTAPGPRESKG